MLFVAGLTVGATFSLGRDGVNAGNPAGTNCAGEATDGRACREWSVLAKYDVYTNLVGSSFAALPAWAAQWSLVDPTLLNITDVNRDGIVQLAEIVIGGDLIVLATPEIAGLPYVVSGLVAAGVPR